MCLFLSSGAHNASLARKAQGLPQWLWSNKRANVPLTVSLLAVRLQFSDRELHWVSLVGLKSKTILAHHWWCWPEKPIPNFFFLRGLTIALTALNSYSKISGTLEKLRKTSKKRLKV
jgi:hypothetical protein